MELKWSFLIFFFNYFFYFAWAVRMYCKDKILPIQGGRGMSLVTVVPMELLH